MDVHRWREVHNAIFILSVPKERQMDVEPLVFISFFFFLNRQRVTTVLGREDYSCEENTCTACSYEI